MDILVTGASGKVGKYVARHLANAGHNVTNLDRIPPAEAFSDIPWVQCDVLDHAALRECVAGFDAVAHLAGIPIPLYHPAEEVFRTNVLGAYNVLEAAAAGRIPRFVFMSSESVLGFAFMERHMDPLFLPMDETHPARPQDPYGMGKWAAEGLCQAVARRTGMEVAILRAPWIWVPEPEETAMYRQLVADPHAWHRQLWAFCGVEDVASGFEAALSMPFAAMTGASEPGAAAKSPAPVFFLCADENWTGQPTGELLAAHYAMPERNTLTGAASALSTARARASLGWAPRQTAGDFTGS